MPVVGVPEQSRVDCRASVLVAVGQTAPRHGSALAYAALLRGVDRDPLHPGAQRGSTLEPLDASDACQPGVLDDLVRGGFRRDAGPGEQHHGWDQSFSSCAKTASSPERTPATIASSGPDATTFGAYRESSVLRVLEVGPAAGVPLGPLVS